MSEETGPAKLLVKAALEALLANAASRLDAKARSDRIKAAALLECADKGYGGLTVANIAKRAKVSTSSIYAEYANRDQLLVAAMEMLFGILAGDVIEVPQIDDPQARVEQLLIAHGQVYSQPLTVWFFRLHATLTWAGHVHLRQMGLHVFHGIDAFWAKFLGELQAQGHLTGIDPDLVVPLLLGPIERCTIIARLGCGEDESGRPSLAAVARHSAATLFRFWGRGAAQPAPSVGDEAAAALMKGQTSYDGAAVPPAKFLRNTPQGQRHSIFQSAKTECHAHGYELSNVRNVAAAAGVSTATLYSHFADKESLFCGALAEEFEQRSPYRDAASRIALDAALMSIAARAADPQWTWMHNVMMASTLSEDPRVVAVGRKQRDETESFLAEVVGGARDVLTLNFLLGAIERSGILALILFGAGAVEIEKLARLAVFTSRTIEREVPMPVPRRETDR